jgi:uncharacterized protein DUF1206
VSSAAAPVVSQRSPAERSELPSPTQAAVDQALAASRSRGFHILVRSGFVARGITYGIIGGLAFALAVGAGHDGAATNQQGALALIASAPLGKVALVGIAVGLLAYALWKLFLGVAGRGPEGGGGRSLKDRVANVSAGLVYFGFFALAVTVLAGASGSEASEPRSTAAGVLSWPAGPVFVALVGLIFIIVCLVQAYEGATGKFLDEAKCDVMGDHGTYTWVDVMGRVGLVARAVVFAVVGYFLVRTAVEYNPNNAIGLDGALREVHSQAYGTWLLAVVATGLIIFAVFSLAEALYRKL